MKPSLHTAIRSLVMAASAIAVPMAALMSHTIAIQMSKLYPRWWPGHEPLPTLTQFWIIAQGRSMIGVAVALVLAVVLCAVAVWVSRRPDTTPWRATGQILVTYAGLALALLMISSTVMAAMIVIQAAPR